MSASARQMNNRSAKQLSWITNLPGHWRVEKLKNITSLRFSNVDKHTKDDELPVRLCNYTDVYYNDMITSNLEFMRATATQDEISAFELQAGDVIVTKDSETWNDIAVPAYVPEHLDGVICGYHLAQIRPNQSVINGKYLFFAFNTAGIQDQFYVAANGVTRYGLPQHALKTAQIPIPPRAEQDAIVAFLDERLADIDRYIAAKKRLIKLLTGQEAAVINRAVTRGLNPDAPLKDSGIEWLGKIPAGWENKRAKFYFQEINERSETGQEELLSVSHITGVTPRSQKNINMFMAETYAGYKICRPGDLVINIMWAWMGAMGVSNYTGIVSSSYGVYRQKKHRLFRTGYLDLLLRTSPYIAEYNCRSTGITSSRLRMYTDDFFNIPIIRPPIEEQDRILAFIQKQTKVFDTGISTAEREIKLMQELRASLIAEAVTGKLKV